MKRQMWTRPEPVDCECFDRPENPWNPKRPVELDPCGCEPQDGRTCGQHQKTPTFSYHIRAADRFVPIRVGEYWVRYANGTYKTFALDELTQRFMDALPVGAGDPAGRSTRTKNDDDEEKNQARVAPLTAGADRQDLPRSDQ